MRKPDRKFLGSTIAIIFGVLSFAAGLPTPEKPDPPGNTSMGQANTLVNFMFLEESWVQGGTPGQIQQSAGNGIRKESHREWSYSGNQIINRQVENTKVEAW